MGERDSNGNMWGDVFPVEKKTVGKPAEEYTPQTFVDVVHLPEPTTIVVELDVTPMSLVDKNGDAWFEVTWKNGNVSRKANFYPGQKPAFLCSGLRVVVRNIVESDTTARTFSAQAAIATGIRPTVCGQQVSEAGE